MRVRSLAPVALMLMSTTAPAQVRDARVAVAAGTIRGTVLTDDQSATPVRRARVTCTSADAVGTTTITDDQGRFACSELPAGRYTIGVSKPTWVPTAYGAKRPLHAGTPLSLTTRATLNIVVRLSRGAVISGVLLDHNNQPAAAATVRALRYEMKNGSRRLDAAATARTDDRGGYRIYGLAAGDYFIGASAPGLGGMSAGDLRLTSDADVRDAESSAAQSRPASPRMVSLAPSYYPAATSVSQAIAVSLGPGEERSGIDFTLQLVPTARVEGSVALPDGGVPASAEIHLIATGGDTPNVPFEGYRPGRPAPDGTFAFAGIPPGTYTLLARAMRPMTTADGVPAPPQMVWASTQIAVDGEPISGVSLSLEPGLTISGRVRFPSSSLPPPELRTVRIAASPNDPQATVSFAPPAVSVQPDGRFTIAGLVPGRYRLSATFPGLHRPGGWLLQSITANAQDALDGSLTIEPNQHVLDALVTFTDRLARLSGTLRSSSDTALDSTVVLFPQDRRLWQPQSRRIQATHTATDGAYAFRDLPAGTYLLSATDDVETGEWFDPAFLERLLPGAVLVHIPDAAAVVQDLRIRGRQRTARISPDSREKVRAANAQRAETRANALVLFLRYRRLPPRRSACRRRSSKRPCLALPFCHPRQPHSAARAANTAGWFAGMARRSLSGDRT